MPDAVCRRPPLYINGRFLLQPPTGVQRFALEVIRTIDSLVSEPRFNTLCYRAAIVTPNGVQIPPWITSLRHIQSGFFAGGYSWEQLDLPRLTSDGILLNLCNLAPVFRRRQVVVIHDATVKAKPEAYSFPFRLAYSTLLPLIIRNSAKILTVSEFSRDEISHWYGVPRSQMSVCYEGAEHILAQDADPSVLSRNGLTSRKYFLAVGVGSAHKNLELLVRAFALARLGPVRLVLTGRRDSRIHGVTNLPLPPAVIHVGHVHDAELRALYEGALALVYPSTYEGFGLPPVEAMICGCPVMINGHGAPAEISGGAAYAVDINNSERLAAGLEEIAWNPHFRARLSHDGRVRARQFTWRASVERILSQCKATST